MSAEDLPPGYYWGNCDGTKWQYAARNIGGSYKPGYRKDELAAESWTTWEIQSGITRSQHEQRERALAFVLGMADSDGLAWDHMGIHEDCKAIAALAEGDPLVAESRDTNPDDLHEARMEAVRWRNNAARRHKERFPNSHDPNAWCLPWEPTPETNETETT
jgi:hypothetical protein